MIWQVFNKYIRIIYEGYILMFRILNSSKSVKNQSKDQYLKKMFFSLDPRHQTDRKKSKIVWVFIIIIAYNGFMLQL